MLSTSRVARKVVQWFLAPVNEVHEERVQYETELERRLAERIEPRAKVERHEPICAHKGFNELPIHRSATLHIAFRECPDCGLVVGVAS